MPLKDIFPFSEFILRQASRSDNPPVATTDDSTPIQQNGVQQVSPEQGGQAIILAPQAQNAGIQEQVAQGLAQWQQVTTPSQGMSGTLAASGGVGLSTLNYGSYSYSTQVGAPQQYITSSFYTPATSGYLASPITIEWNSTMTSSYQADTFTPKELTPEEVEAQEKRKLEAEEKALIAKRKYERERRIAAREKKLQEQRAKESLIELVEVPTIQEERFIDLGD